MLRIAAVLLALLALPASARAAGEVYTLAGPLADGAKAVPDPAGGFLVADQTDILRVDARGVMRKVAGTGEYGSSGDGGPALKAELTAYDVAPLPGGGFAFADAYSGRVRMVDAAGTITTVAKLRDLSFAIAAAPGGGVLVIAGHRVERLGPDGRITPLAGTGTDPADSLELVTPRGQPATAVALDPGSLAVAADGSVLLTEPFFGRIDRVAPDGTITVALETHDLAALDIAATPDGGFLYTDPTRVWRVDPFGNATVVAGGGPLTLSAPLGLEQRLDGGPAQAVPIDRADAVAPLPDGGLLLTANESNVLQEIEADYVRYVASAAPALLGVALLRDRDRVFTPGRPGAVSVSLSLPATVTLTVAGRSSTAALPAGVSRVPLPPLDARPRMVSLAAVDAAGRQASDAARVFPDGWLPVETAQLIADAIGARALWPGASAELCTHFGHARVDCELHSGERCRNVSILYAHARLRWGAYRCHLAVHPRYLIAPHRLRRTEWSCDAAAGHRCRPPFFGRVAEAALLPAEQVGN